MLKNQSFNLFRVFLISLFLFSYTADGKYGFYHTIDADYFELDECKISHKKPALVDLCILKKSITYLHPNPYFKQSKKAFESSFLFAKQELSESDNRDEHIKTFAKLVAQINDPHTFVVMYFSRLLSYQMSINLFRHLIKLPSSYFEKRHSGDISTRFSSIKPIQNLLTSDIVSVVIDGIMAITTLIVMFCYSFKLSLIVISFLTIYFSVYWLIFSKIRNLQEKIIHFSSEEHTLFLETLRASKTIKMFVREQERQIQYQSIKADTINSQIALQKLKIYFSIFKKFIFSTLSILMLFILGNFVISGDFSLGMMFAFQSYKSKFTRSIKALIENIMSFRMLGLHLDRLSDIVSTPNELSDDKAPPLSTTLVNKIYFKDVSFKYSESDPFIIKNLSLQISRGETICIVGPSGRGKSTLVKLILSLQKPSCGEVLIDKHSLENIGLTNYRKIYGVVAQDDTLMSGTLAENISFFSSDNNLCKVIKAARIANIHEQIDLMPMKYSTLIGDMGSSLSGGQKQRVMLARAVYNSPQILILDEGTANLDKFNERKVLKNLESLDMTKIYIAHREEVIKKADRILELNNGRLHEISISDWRNKYAYV